MQAFIRLPKSKASMDILNPRSSDWTDEDLAYKLACVPRWAGESIFDLPLSVAQHSLFVMALRLKKEPSLCPRLALYEALHDAEEAFLGFDAISPLKTFLGDQLQVVTDRLSRAITERYQLPKLTDSQYVQHKIADHIAAASEAFHIVGWSTLNIRTQLVISAEILEFDPFAEYFNLPHWTPQPVSVIAPLFLETIKKFSQI